MNASSMYIETEKLPGYEAFKANDENPETGWQADGTTDEWLEVEWLKPQTFNTVVIDEVGNYISSYKLQYWQHGKWTDITSGETCGEGRTHTFDQLRTTKCRVWIDHVLRPPKISELKIFDVKS
ncbi:discoidin domain-containing protein [Reichenbachiella ulvae]|uniref:Discoidin domain-containing protein n=1 Tax=Reichenbachiella ulvae TaxID=2980104 RepID=A0ABT3CT40_9BACT|nr:discoidin domain-containing protein [Reichenbachiella ulvae]MCV9386640.1 discoidin domain-containing protein [Reichenbachiella ulvae]